MYLREYFFRPDTQSDAIPMIGVSKNLTSRREFTPHQHAWMEICVVTGGVIEYFTENDHYTLGPGAIQISQPKQFHGLPGDLLHPCKLYWIHVVPADLGSPRLTQKLAQLPHHLESGGVELVPHLEAILENCRHPSPNVELEQQARLWMLLSTLLRLANSQAEASLPATLKRALSIINESESPLRISELAQQLNTHRSNLHRLFASHLGVSPQAYLNERRLRRAAEQLQTSSCSITDIALNLEFSTTQHFATAFKARYGESPSAFRQKSVG